MKESETIRPKEKISPDQRPAALFGVFDDASDAVLIADQGLNIVYANKKAIGLSGFTREELLQRKIDTYFDKEDLHNPLIRYEKIRDTAIHAVNHWVRRRNGTLVDVSVSITSFTPGYSICIIRDLTVQNLTSEQRALNESLMTKAFDFSPFGNAHISLEGKWIKVNRAFCRITGYSEQELLRLYVEDITHPDDQKADTAFLKASLEGQDIVYHTEKRYIHKNGSVAWVKIHSSLLRDQENQPLFFVVHIEDITDKKEIEQQLQTKEQLLRLMVENSPVALAMFDKDMRYLVVSNRYLSDYKLAVGTIIGKSHYEVFPDIPERLKAVHRRCLQGEQVRKTADKIPINADVAEWVNWEMLPWYAADGTIGGAILFAQLITDDKEADLKFRNLVEKSQVGVYIIQHGKFVYVNPRFAEIFGYTQDEMNDLPVDVIVAASERETVDRNIRERVQGGLEYVHYETLGLRKDGTIINTEAFGNRTIYKGAPAVIGSLLDITERKKTALQNEQKTAQLTAISDNLPDALVYQAIGDEKGNRHFTYISEGVRKLTGMSAAETLVNQELLYGFFTAADLRKIKEAEAVSFRNLSVFNMDVCLRLANGEPRIMNMHSTPQKQPDGSVVWNGLLTDITNRKKTEQDLVTLNRLYILKSKVNELMLAATHKDTILSSLCDVAVTYGNFRMAWIGYYDAESKQVVPYISAGHDNGYTDKIRINTLKNSAAGKGPTGKALRTRVAQCCNDIDNDPDLAFWHAEARERNFRSSAALPIIVNDEIVAVLSLYMSEPFFFTETEMSLLQDITHNISFGLDKIRITEEKRKTEQELLESIQVNRSMIAAIPDKIFRFRKDGTIVYVHSSNQAALFLPAEKLMGARIRDILPAETAAMIMSAIERTLQTQQMVQIEYPLPIGGKIQYNEARLVPIEQSAEQEVFMIVRDITEEREAEAALQKSYKDTADYRYAIDQAALVDISDVDGSITYVNDKFCEVSGYTEEELIGKPHNLLSADYHTQAFFKDLWETIISGKVWQGEIMGKTKGGHVFWVDTTIVPFLDENSKPFQFLSIRKEITNRKQSEAELRASEEKFRVLIEGTQLSVYIVQDNRLRYLNPVFETATGYAKEQLLGRMCFVDLLHPDDRLGMEAYMHACMKGIVPGKKDPVRLVRADGRIRIMDIITSPILYEGKPGLIGSAVDITDKIQEEERMAKAVSDAQEKERQQIGMELHDNVKQLLVACDIRLSFIQQKLDDRSKAEEHLKVTRDIVAKAINDLRDISHQLTPIVEDGLPVDQSIELLVKRMNLRNIMEVSVHCDEKVKQLPPDVHLAFYRIVQEQVNNIIKYAKAHSIQVSVEEKTDHICLRIIDDGIGFNITQRTEGIGLENMRHRVRALRGQLNIVSVPGNGCEIDVRVPK